MFQPLTQLNYFFRLATERKLSGSDQLLWLHLFNLFNRQHWTETLRINDAKLKDLLQLHDSNGKPASIDTIRRCRQRLKAKGFIDFTTRSGQEPEYRFIQLYPANTPVDTPVDTPADTGLVSYTHAGEDVKTQRQNDSMARACARGKKKPKSTGLVCYTYSQINELENLTECWEKAGGCKLNELLVSKLEAMLNVYGFSKMKEAINDANEGTNSIKNGFSLEFFRLKLEAILKRGEKSEKQAKQYRAPKVDREIEKEIAAIKL